MDSFNGGLNFVPLLAQTPINRNLSISRRGSSMSLHKVSLACYNGNYEGDSSMFGTKLQTVAAIHKGGSTRHGLIESDSDTEYKKELEQYRNPQRQHTDSQARRLWKHYKAHLLENKRLAQMAKYAEQLKANYYYQKFCELVRFVWTLLIVTMRWSLGILLSFGCWSYGMWRSRSMLRNLARRLLWSMTLAKCGDVAFFGLILLSTPLLFVASLFGFLLSAYCALKECLTRSGYYLRSRVF